MKRLLCLCLCLVCLFGVLELTVSAEKTFPDTTEARAVCLYNLNTANYIYSKAMNEKIFPAGAVKMCAGLIACEMLSARLDDKITVSSDMLIGASGANIKLKAGMTVKAVDLLYGVICGGGNDASLVLACVCSQNPERFTELMNDKAREWGLAYTHFTNPSGTDDKNMYSTLSDIMIIAQRAAQNELYMKISSAQSYEFTPEGAGTTVKFFNRNALISTFYSADYKFTKASGMIVGNTDLGGQCVISLAKSGNTEYICAVMGAAQDEDNIYSYKIATELFSFAFDNFSYSKIAEAGALTCSLPLSMVPSDNNEPTTVLCTLKNDVYALIERGLDTDSRLTYRYYFHAEPLAAPVSAGSVVGGVDIMLDGEIIGTGVMVAAGDVAESNMHVLMNNMKSFFVGRLFITFALIFTLLSLFYFLVYEKRLRHRTSKKVNFTFRKK